MRYSIVPKEIELASAKAKDREYEQGNYKVEMYDPEFNGVVDGDSLVHDVDYTITPGRIPSDAVGSYNAFYSVSMINQNYTFLDGTRTVSGISPVKILPSPDEFAFMGINASANKSYGNDLSGYNNTSNTNLVVPYVFKNTYSASSNNDININPEACITSEASLQTVTQNEAVLNSQDAGLPDNEYATVIGAVLLLLTGSTILAIRKKFQKR